MRKFYNTRRDGAGGNTSVPGVITPSAPTNMVIDDTANTFNWTYNPEYTNNSDYEYTLNGGSSYTIVGSKPVSVGDINLGAGQAGVRVRAGVNRTVSATLFTSNSFTQSATNGTISTMPTFTSTGPSGETAPGDAFSFVTSATANGSAPSFNEAIDIASGGDTVPFTAEGLVAGFSQVKVYDGSQLLDATIRRIESRRCTITVPGTGSGVKVMWVSNASGYSKPFILNRPKIYWIEALACPGEAIHVYGKSLSKNMGTTTSSVYIKPASGAGQYCTIQDVNPYRIKFVIPPSLTPGSYQVWVHNNTGGAIGWSAPINLTIANTVDNPKVRTWGTEFVVSTMTSAGINSVATSAGSSGNTLKFNAGVYTITAPITNNNNTKWLGAALDGSGNPTTILRLGANFTNYNGGLITNRTCNNFMFENIKFDRNGFSTGGRDSNSFIYFHNATKVIFKNCQIDARYLIALDVRDSSKFYFDGCTIIGGSTQWTTTTNFDGVGQLFIHNCKFRFTNDSAAAILGEHVPEFSLTNSNAQDLDNTTTDGSGWGKGRFYSTTGNQGGSTCGYFAFNTGNSLGTRISGTNKPDGNSGEIILWEAATADFKSSPIAATSTTLTFSTAPNPLTNTGAPGRWKSAYVTHGKGYGQLRRITNYNGTTITLDEPWNTIPDATSVVILGPFVDRQVVYKNTFDALGKTWISNPPVQFQTASGGTELYGGTSGVIVDGNTYIALKDGVTVQSTFHSTQTTDMSAWTLVKNNTATSCRWGFWARVGLGHPITPNYDVEPYESLIGTTYRDNVATNSVKAPAAYYVRREGVAVYPGTSTQHASVDHIVWDRNSWSNTIDNHLYEEFAIASTTMASIPEGVVKATYLNNG